MIDRRRPSPSFKTTNTGLYIEGNRWDDEHVCEWCQAGCTSGQPTLDKGNLSCVWDVCQLG
jgi:hypothetical protein